MSWGHPKGLRPPHSASPVTARRWHQPLCSCRILSVSVQWSLAARHTSPMVQSKSNRVTWHGFALIRLSESQFKRAAKGKLTGCPNKEGTVFLSFPQEVESNTSFCSDVKVIQKNHATIKTVTFNWTALGVFLMILSLFCTLGDSCYYLLSSAETDQSNHLTLPLPACQHSNKCCILWK